MEYFAGLFASLKTQQDEILSLVQSQITMEQNQYLLEPYTADEVKEAIFSVHPDKSPGPEGMNPTFFQRFWSIVGSNVTSAFLHVLNTCSMPPNLNDTVIVLIPKEDPPEHVTDLRPISLCNVFYKIIAKTLANRLKKAVGDMLGDEQSASVEGRLITDKVLIAAEVNNYLKRKNQGKVGVAALNIDMIKAFYCMEWSFLSNMMAKMGFAAEFIDMIMLCVSSMRYFLAANGNLLGCCNERRLRQRDPLSPYLFIIGAEGLLALIKKEEQSRRSRGCRVARTASAISHLFFADDSFLFFRASIEETGVMRQCFSTYEAASGQSINFQKSSISFSKNTTAHSKQAISQTLGVSITDNYGLYLGLPSTVGKNKKDVFSFMVEKSVFIQRRERNPN